MVFIVAKNDLCSSVKHDPLLHNMQPLSDMMEPAMIMFHCWFISLESKKCQGSYSPSSEDTYHCRFKPQTRQWYITAGSNHNLTVISVISLPALAMTRKCFVASILWLHLKANVRYHCQVLYWPDSVLYHWIHLTTNWLILHHYFWL